MNIPRIFVTPGEPAGVGPDVTIKMAQLNWPADIIAIANPDVLSARAKKLRLPLELQEVTPFDKPTKHKKGTLKFISVPVDAPVVPRMLNPLNAPYVLRTVELATELCLKQNAALVTGPIHKAHLQASGINFMGHTEFLAQQSGVALTVMMFVLKNMKIALATTHLPLAQVAAAVTKAHLLKVLNVLHHDLQKKFGIKQPRIAVCGLNPHAGENGHLGFEEIEIITPALNELRAQQYQLEGPLPADTAFLPQQLKKSDAILAMYHDQALPLVKYLGFDSAVNVTLGLPFIRTSVDHGTALDIAGTAKSDPGSMEAAIKLAIELS